MSQRVLVTGAAGVVGAALSAKFTATFPGCSFVDLERTPPREAGPAGLRTCDLTSGPAVVALMDEVTPDVVVHLAGSKDVFALEQHPEQATRANVDTTRNIIDAAKGSKTLVIYVSTDYVFEGNAGPYNEASPTHPTTAYGRSKLAAEHLLLASDLPVAIARSSSLFGYEGDFISVVERALRQGRAFVAFSDLVSNPTDANDFFALLARIISRRVTGIFHTAGREPVSRDAFARKVAKAASLNVDLIKSEPRQERVRPADLSLDNAATYTRLEHFPRMLDEILADRRAASQLSEEAK